MGMLDGKVALITGAARGIGAATARLFAAEGATVVLTDRDSQPLATLRDEIEASGQQAHAYACDLTQGGAPQELVSFTAERTASLDILINNAGYTWDGALHALSDEQWSAMLDLHLTAPFRMMRAFFPLMHAAITQEQAVYGSARPRKIMNISSVAALSGNAGQANYAAAKAGLFGLSKSAAKEFGKLNIQVNCVCFGLIETRLSSPKGQASIQQGEQAISLGIPAIQRQRLIAQTALGRSGTVEEAAGALLFFASPLSNYVTGQVLEVSGGLIH